MKITVVTVCSNAEATIGETIDSVARQDWSDFEHLVLDGASQDATAAVVAAKMHSRLRFTSEPDKGIYDAMNKGVHFATGDYVGFLNADDFFSSVSSLRMVAEAALETGADCIIGDTAFVDEDGRRKGRLYTTVGFGRWWLRIGAMPPHPSFYARTELLRHIGGFDTNYRIGADFDLVARLLLQRRASWARVGQVITCFRVGGVSTSGIAAKRAISREMAASLRGLGQPAAGVAVQLRYPVKLLQYAAGAFGRFRGRRERD